MKKGDALIVSYGYLMEIFYAWYSASSSEQYIVENRFSGPYAPLYWALVLSNVVIPQALWSKRVRDNSAIIVTSLHRDYLPSSWDMYYATVWDWATQVGTIGLFSRFLPVHRGNGSVVRS